MVTKTGNDPHPLLLCLKRKSISCEILMGTVKKCHASVDGWSQREAIKENEFILLVK